MIRTPGESRWQLVILGAALCLSGASLIAAMRPAQQAAPTSVAVVNVNKVIDALKESQDLHVQYRARRDQIVELLKQGLTKEDALKADAEGTKPEDPTFRTKRLAYFKQRESNKADRELYDTLLAIEGGDIRAGLYARVVAAVSKIAERDKYDIVLLDDHTTEFPDGPDDQIRARIAMAKVIHRGEHTDLTAQVVLAMNNDYAAKR